MTGSAKLLQRIALPIAVGVVSLLWNGNVTFMDGERLISSADARVGRPLTPVSYAGVARRTTRRAVAVGAATAPVYVAPTPACVQVVNAYGQISYACP